MSYEQLKESIQNPAKGLAQQSSPLDAIFKTAFIFESSTDDADSVMILVERSPLQKLQESLITIGQEKTNSIEVKHISGNYAEQNKKLQELLQLLAQLKG